MNITIIAGARPNFMKIAPITRAVKSAQQNNINISYTLIYTGREEDKSIDKSLFEDLDMEQPDIYLNVESNNFTELAAGIMMAFDKHLNETTTDLILVVDDLTATMSCAIVAKKRGIKIAHLVAGTRSFDMDMPKEPNRMITDGLSDFLFTAGAMANRNLNCTGTANKKIFCVGNILVDSIRHNRTRLIQPKCLSKYNIKEKEYLLFTLNRKAVVNNSAKLKEIVETLIEKSKEVPIIAPLRRYVAEAIEKLELDTKQLYIIPSERYLTFAYLVNHAKGIITDSGNIAEEATFLGIPCITLNTYAEHPETYKVGTNVLVGEDCKLMASKIDEIIRDEWKESQLPNQWDGKTAKRIIQILTSHF